MLVGFFFNDTATTEIYTLSLHDALPIYRLAMICERSRGFVYAAGRMGITGEQGAVADSAGVLAKRMKADRKSTRLNSSHANISYAVFCLKKKKLSTRSTQG